MESVNNRYILEQKHSQEELKKMESAIQDNLIKLKIKTTILKEYEE